MKKKIFMIVLIILIPLKVYAITDTAKSTIVMDMDSGRILYEKNAEEQRLVASISKIMTAVIAIENANLNDEVTVGEEVLSMYGSSIYVELGEKMRLIDLIYGLLLRSGNDAAIVIANYVSGSEEKFVDLMNKKAKQIGMKNTIYKNPHGLDEKTKNYSTAKDMSILSSYANKIDIYKQISSTKKWVVKTDKKSYIWNNRNKLLYSYEYATGGKTGYTPSAGRTLVTTASKNNLNLTVVTLSDANEYETHKSLYEYYFNKYNNYIILDKDNISFDKNVIKDTLYVKENFKYPITESEKAKIETIVKINKQKKYKNNESVGKYYVYLDKEKIFETNIYVKIKSNSASFFNKFKKFLSKIL